MNNMFTKIMAALIAVALAFAAFPVSSAFAADENPPALTDEQIETAWARQTGAYERLGKAFEDTDAHIAKFQSMLDKAAENGRDVADLQAALDAYAAALVASRPAYETLGQVFRTHSGFDANGKVTDSEKALITIKEARDQMKTIKDSMGGSFKALREALKAFREANKPAEGAKERDS